MVEKPKKWTRKYDFPDKVFTHAHTWALEVPSGLEVAKDYICDTTSSMFYSIMMANLLKEQYIAENGVEYDLVIRNRIDYNLISILNNYRVSIIFMDVIYPH